MCLIGGAFGGACGNTGRGRTSAGQAGEAGGPVDENTAGNTSSGSSCGDAEKTFPLWGHAYDAKRDCIDTESYLENVGCIVLDGDPYAADGYACLERLSDRQQFWVFAFYRLEFDPTGWRRCPDAPILPPKGCYAADCPSSPRSTCSLAETRNKFGCGPRAEFDENCCGRATCELPKDCRPGEQCVLVDTRGQIDCWDNPGNPCDCGGAPGGPRKRLCLPEPAASECTAPDGTGACPEALTLFHGRLLDEAAGCLEAEEPIVCGQGGMAPTSCWVDAETGARLLMDGQPCLPPGGRFRLCTNEETFSASSAPSCE